MKIFLAAVYSNNYMPGQSRYEKLTDHERQLVVGLPNILESYHYVGKQKAVDEMRNNHAKVFLDSGAFSAWTLGVTITIQEYVDYINRNRDILRVEDGAVMASVLDAIGDDLGTWRNQLEMEARGATPLPCFHFGEDERFLQWYVEKYSYITIGGMVGKSQNVLFPWLDRLWDRYLTDGSGKAKIKVHGFGITARPIMERYPWYSVDSSSWIQSAAFGSIETPRWGPVRVSDKSPARHTAGQHVSNLSELEQDQVLQYLESQGFTYERLSTIYESRAAYNLWAYGVINEMMNASKSEHYRATLQELFQ